MEEPNVINNKELAPKKAEQEVVVPASLNDVPKLEPEPVPEIPETDDEEEEIQTEINSEWEKYKNQIILRKFDSDDIIRMRSESLIAEGVIEKDSKMKSKVRMDTAMMQKVSVICGIKTCPWFSDLIDERVGVNETIYRKRKESEFRKIPTEILDNIFREVRLFNKNVFIKEKFQKN